MIVERTNFEGKKVQLDLPVTREQIRAWENGAYIQNVMPHLDADQREFLLTGMLPGEWDILFPPEEDEDYV